MFLMVSPILYFAIPEADPEFPTWGTNIRGGANLLIDIIFAENCMKMKTNVTEGGRV